MMNDFYGWFPLLKKTYKIFDTLMVKFPLDNKLAPPQQFLVQKLKLYQNLQ